MGGRAGNYSEASRLRRPAALSAGSAQNHAASPGAMAFRLRVITGSPGFVVWMCAQTGRAGVAWVWISVRVMCAK